MSLVAAIKQVARINSLAVDLGWLTWLILAKRAWPKIRNQQKRAITAEEHGAVIACEGNEERRAYFEILYETGAAQTRRSEFNGPECRLEKRSSRLPPQEARGIQRTGAVNDWIETPHVTRIAPHVSAICFRLSREVPPPIDHKWKVTVISPICSSASNTLPFERAKPFRLTRFSHDICSKCD